MTHGYALGPMSVNAQLRRRVRGWGAGAGSDLGRAAWAAL